MMTRFLNLIERASKDSFIVKDDWDWGEGF